MAKTFTMITRLHAISLFTGRREDPRIPAWRAGPEVRTILHCRHNRCMLLL